MSLGRIPLGSSFSRTYGRFVLAMTAVLLASAGAAFADELKPADAKGIEFFESKIRPVFVAHCYKCHSRAEGKSEGGLLLDTRDAIRKGGDRGPAVVPGDSQASVLLTASHPIGAPHIAQRLRETAR